jgi:hypothetical protein
MFLPLVVLLPLFCLTLAAALEGLIDIWQEGLTRRQLGPFGHVLWNLGAAGALLAILPITMKADAELVRPLFDLSVEAALIGTVFVRAGQSVRPMIWFGLALVGLIMSLAIWMVAAL